jgi:hypothetical protein
MPPKILGKSAPGQTFGEMGRQEPLNNLDPEAWTTQKPGIGKKSSSMVTPFSAESGKKAVASAETVLPARRSPAGRERVRAQ